MLRRGNGWASPTKKTLDVCMNGEFVGSWAFTPTGRSHTKFLVAMVVLRRGTGALG
jgi:hypothetical protein